jgi:hypothetical protein
MLPRVATIKHVQCKESEPTRISTKNNAHVNELTKPYRWSCGCACATLARDLMIRQMKVALPLSTELNWKVTAKRFERFMMNYKPVYARSKKNWRWKSAVACNPKMTLLGMPQIPGTCSSWYAQPQIRDHWRQNEMYQEAVPNVWYDKWWTWEFIAPVRGLNDRWSLATARSTRNRHRNMMHQAIEVLQDMLSIYATSRWCAACSPMTLIWGRPCWSWRHTSLSCKHVNHAPMLPLIEFWSPCFHEVLCNQWGRKKQRHRRAGCAPRSSGASDGGRAWRVGSHSIYLAPPTSCTITPTPHKSDTLRITHHNTLIHVPALVPFPRLR